MHRAHARRSLAAAVAALLLAGGPVGPASGAEEAEPATWRLLNTFLYQGTTWGPATLNMEAGRANGIFPSGQIAILDGEVRTWVTSPMSPDPIEFGTGEWTVELGGNSVVSRLEWIPGVYDPETETFTPAAGTPSYATGVGPSTFTPSAPFTLPAGANLALRVSGAFGSGAPSIVDTYDEQGERSPSSLSYSGGADLETEVERGARRASDLACAHRPAVPAEGCPEVWSARQGTPVDTAASGLDLIVSRDDGVVFVAGNANDRTLNTDMVIVARDTATGAVIWEDRYDGPGGPHDAPDEVLLSPDGETLYVTGRVCITPTSNNLNCTSDYDNVVIAYETATGMRRWVRTFGGPGQQNPQTAALSPDGGTLVVGGFTSEIAGPQDPQDVYVAALDAAAGEVRWEATYAGASNLQDSLRGSAFDPDGDVVYVAGSTRSEDTGHDFLLLGFDAATGERMFQRVLDGGAGGDDRAADVLVDGETLYATGGAIPPGGDAADALTFAIDLVEGRELWRVWHDGAWGGADSGTFLEISGDRVIVGGTEAESAVVSDAFVSAYDVATGATRWSSRFSRPGRKSYDYLRDMHLSPDGRRVVLAVEGGWFSNSSRDFVTLVHDAATGERLLRAVYDGPHRGSEIPSGVGSTTDGSRVFVTGASQSAIPTTLVVSWDMATIAYDVPAEAE